MKRTRLSRKFPLSRRIQPASFVGVSFARAGYRGRFVTEIRAGPVYRRNNYFRAPYARRRCPLRDGRSRDPLDRREVRPEASASNDFAVQNFPHFVHSKSCSLRIYLASDASELTYRGGIAHDLFLYDDRLTDERPIAHRRATTRKNSRDPNRERRSIFLTRATTREIKRQTRDKVSPPPV